VEAGKSGFASVRAHDVSGTAKYPPEKYNQVCQRAGAASNAFTSDDLTAYYTFSKEDLPTILPWKPIASRP
jgi:zinc protease